MSAKRQKKSAFQSTPSVGRATAKVYKYISVNLYRVHIKLHIFATTVLFACHKQLKKHDFSVRTCGDSMIDAASH